MNQTSWRGEDQFDTFIFSHDLNLAESYDGFNFIQLRKKQDSNDPNSYEYRIGKNATLTTAGGDENFASIIKPKPPGEWIDLTLEEKNLYLYLECIFSVESRNSNNNITKYKISSAKLITVEEGSLPNNFSGTFEVEQDNNDYSYYKTTLGRQLLAIFFKNDLPICLFSCYNMQLSSVNLNGFTKSLI